MLKEQMIIEVQVKPQQREEKIIKESEKKYTVYLKAPAHEGKANEALLKLLKKYLKKQCRIKSGATSKRKLIEIQD